MGKSSQVFSFIRRTAVVYVFMLLIGVLMVVYYYYYIPGNQQEFNERGTRVLKTLVQNFLQRSVDFDSTIHGAKTTSFIDFTGEKNGYEILHENMKYDWQKDWDSTRIEPFIEGGSYWKISYPIDSPKGKVSLPMQDFGDRLFDARRDIFHTYLLLIRDSSGRDGLAKQRWSIVYREDDVTTYNKLSLDTLPYSLKNSDQSAIVDISISDNDEKLFLQSFDFHGQQVLLGGLIGKKDYRHYIRHTPTTFISRAIILVVLLIVAFPFLKIFFLSSNEQITSRDVVASTVSIFIGSAAVLIILLYLCTSSVAGQAFRYRTQDVAQKIGGDLEGQLQLASAQLNAYQHLYERLDVGKKGVLSYTNFNTTTHDSLSSIFLPRIFPGVSRVIWIDAQGNTVAKWNPFRISPPLTSVRTYDFFRMLNENGEKTKGLVVYAGKSNVTGEFQAYMAKRIDQNKNGDPASSGGPDSARAASIVIAGTLHCMMPPVLPPGFGFCIIDDHGRVLIHSDSRRNISENLLQETGNDERLKGKITLRSDGVVPEAKLYGDVQDLYVRPLRDQPLFVVVFFDRQHIMSGTARILHFTILSLLYLFLSLAIVIAFSTHSIGGPSRLRFAMYKIEWIRLTEFNRYSYHFTFNYFLLLFASYGLLFGLIGLFHFDMRLIYYISLLMPLYALWSFIIGRTNLFMTSNLDEAKYTTGELLGEIFFTTKTILAMVFVFNGLLFWQMGKIGVGNCIALVSLQLVWIGMMIFFYLRMAERRLAECARDFSKEVKSKIRTNYMNSLLLSVLLVSILPTIGVFVYAFHCEKMQYKKSKELQVAGTYLHRRLALQSKPEDQYEPGVAASFATYLDTVTRRSGIYLSDNDAVGIEEGLVSTDKKLNRVDEPYRFLTDNLYNYTLPAFGQITIGNKANDADSSWEFYSGRRSVSLSYRSGKNKAEPVFVRSNFQDPITDFTELNSMLPLRLFFMALLFLFLYAGWKLITATITRIFFLSLNSSDNINKKYLPQLFTTIKPDPAYSSGLEDNPAAKKECFFDTEKNYQEKGMTQEEYILKLEHYYAPVYEVIWEELSPIEQYMLFDLALDGYTNYKNSDVIYRMINKGIVICNNYQIAFFSMSFRNYVISKKDTKEMQDLLALYAGGGVWQSIRVPAYMLMLAVLVFIVFTQSEVAHDLTALITSSVALIPVLLQLLGKGSKKE